LVPYFGGVFRLATDTLTPFGGFALGLDPRPLRAGVLVLGTQRRTPLGTEALMVAAGVLSLELLPIGASASLCTNGELGVALAIGVPHDTAVGKTAAGLHWGVSAGPRVSLSPSNGGLAFEASADAGWASSLTAQSEGRDAIALHGWFLGATLGIKAR
jgi:hypothetical protein